jgi:hypothetical protein
VLWPVRQRSGACAVVTWQSPPRIWQTAVSTALPILPSSPSAKIATKIAATAASTPAYSELASPRSSR